MAVGFYCLGSLDLMGLLQSKTSEVDRESYTEWIWEQYTRPYTLLNTSINSFSLERQATSMARGSSQART
jgi:hypothetical protein